MKFALAKCALQAAVDTVAAAQPLKQVYDVNDQRTCFLVVQVSMNEMMEIIMGFNGKKLPIRHIPGPEGVRGRNSDNALILEKLGWEPTVRLADGLRVTYFWIKRQLEEVRTAGSPCPPGPRQLRSCGPVAFTLFRHFWINQVCMQDAWQACSYGDV